MPPTRRRSGLSSSGLDSVIPTAAPEPPEVTGTAPERSTEPQERPAAVAKAAGVTTNQRPKVVKFGGYIDPEIAEQARDALSALGGSWTLGALMEQALVREVERLAAEHNGGRPFPSRAEERLRTGPRIK